MSKAPQDQTIEELARRVAALDGDERAAFRDRLAYEEECKLVEEMRGRLADIQSGKQAAVPAREAIAQVRRELSLK